MPAGVAGTKGRFGQLLSSQVEPLSLILTVLCEFQILGSHKCASVILG